MWCIARKDSRSADVSAVPGPAACISLVYLMSVLLLILPRSQGSFPGQHKSPRMSACGCLRLSMRILLATASMDRRLDSRSRPGVAQVVDLCVASCVTTFAREVYEEIIELSLRGWCSKVGLIPSKHGFAHVLVLTRRLSSFLTRPRCAHSLGVLDIVISIKLLSMWRCSSRAPPRLYIHGLCR